MPRAGETPHDGRVTLGIRRLRHGGGRPAKKSPCNGCALCQTAWFPFCALDSSAIDPPVRPLRERSRLVSSSRTVTYSTFPESGPLQVAARPDSTLFLDPTGRPRRPVPYGRIRSSEFCDHYHFISGMPPPHLLRNGQGPLSHTNLNGKPKLWRKPW
jgi:hypothetical protein